MLTQVCPFVETAVIAFLGWDEGFLLVIHALHKNVVFLVLEENQLQVGGHTYAYGTVPFVLHMRG